MQQRDRWFHALATAAVIALGLASRKWQIFPPMLEKYPGDALYALMAFCALGVLSPRASTARNAAYALAFCFAVEASQLYHAPWIDRVRATTLGHLALGSRFGWWDLVAYAVGVAVGAIGEWLVSRAVPATPATRPPADGK
jgi:Protein of unknown function (DUF2809)